MGYLPLNLTTLQLPAPSSNMTKAEYKQAYGIDLDAINIKAFRLVVFGNQKYAIDQIKEVEDGIEIYFNGRIMSITDIVQVSDEVYNVANSKPLYYHPILMQSNLSGDPVFALSIVIINNSETPFTLESFIDWATQLGEVVGGDVIINCSGFFKSSSAEVTSVSHLLFVPGDESWRIRGGVGGTSTLANVTLTKTGMANLPVTTFNDGVNKLN